jgi:hypothetical protein
LDQLASQYLDQLAFHSALEELRFEPYKDQLELDLLGLVDTGLEA